MQKIQKGHSHSYLGNEPTTSTDKQYIKPLSPVNNGERDILFQNACTKSGL